MADAAGLRGKADGFFAEAVVETVNGGHEFPVFSGGFIVVEECILQTVERLDFVENNAGGFVGDAGPVNLPQPLFRSADKLSGMGSRSLKKDKGGVVVLFSGGKAVSSQKNAEGSGNGVLPAQADRDGIGEFGKNFTQQFIIFNLIFKTAGSGKALGGFFGFQFQTGRTVKLKDGLSQTKVKTATDLLQRRLGEFPGGKNSEIAEFGAQMPADAPDINNVQLLQLFADLFRVFKGECFVGGFLFGAMGGDFAEGFGRGNAGGNRDAGFTENPGADCGGQLLKVFGIRQPGKGFVNGIYFQVGKTTAQDGHYPGRHVGIKLVIG